MRSSAITSALITKLWADAALKALAPDGVFKGVAGGSMTRPSATATRFVIVSLASAFNSFVFEGRSALRATYLVEARMLSTAGGDVNAAAARIDELLDPQPPAAPLTLTIPGWALLLCRQEAPTEDVEFDDADRSIRWDRGGGEYELRVAPIAT
jgi:hypothetical protein